MRLSAVASPVSHWGQSHAKRSAVARAQSIGQAEFASQRRLEGQQFFNGRDPPGHSAVGNLRQAFAQLQAHQPGRQPTLAYPMPDPAGFGVALGATGIEYEGVPLCGQGFGVARLRESRTPVNMGN